jgi:hypothetical protein
LTIYHVLTETFYESYVNGEEPPEDAWVLDWNDWAGTYEIWLRRREQYRTLVQALRKHTRHIPPDIKHHRGPAPEISFTRPNLSFLIQEIERMLRFRSSTSIPNVIDAEKPILRVELEHDPLAR